MTTVEVEVKEAPDDSILFMAFPLGVATTADGTKVNMSGIGNTIEVMVSKDDRTQRYWIHTQELVGAAVDLFNHTA